MRNPTVNKSHRMICMNVLETLYQMVIVSRISNEFANVRMHGGKNKIHTSSTAQGGGGSFKKRKTIGEIGCCESRMSKQKH